MQGWWICHQNGISFGPVCISYEQSDISILPVVVLQSLLWANDTAWYQRHYSHQSSLNFIRANVLTRSGEPPQTMAHKRHWGLTMRMLFWCILTLLLRAEGHEEGEGERRAGDFVGTHNENDGLQDGRHDRFPCTKEPQVIPWDNAHVFKINHEPFTDKKAGFEWFWYVAYSVLTPSFPHIFSNQGVSPWLSLLQLYEGIHGYLTKQPLFSQVFVRKGEVPPLTQVSVADFKAGGYFEAHDHEDMFERLRLHHHGAKRSFIHSLPMLPMFTCTRDNYLNRAMGMLRIKPQVGWWFKLFFLLLLQKLKNHWLCSFSLVRCTVFNSHSIAGVQKSKPILSIPMSAHVSGSFTFLTGAGNLPSPNVALTESRGAAKKSKQKPGSQQDSASYT